MQMQQGFILQTPKYEIQIVKQAQVQHTKVWNTKQTDVLEVLTKLEVNHKQTTDQTQRDNKHEQRLGNTYNL